MASLRFEWDPRKATTNLRKHGISFAEAETAFFDDFAVVVEDPDRADDEERFCSSG